MLDPVAASGSAEVLLTQSLPALADYLGRSVALMLLAGLLILKADMARRIVILRGLQLALLIMPLCLWLVPPLTVERPVPTAAEMADILNESLNTEHSANRLAAGPAFPLDVSPSKTGKPSFRGLHTMVAACLVALWMTVSMIRIAILTGQLVMLGRWRRAQSPSMVLSAGRRLVRIYFSRQISSPLGYGWRQPVILIPASWQTDPRFGAADVDNALAHELAHLSRGDWPWLLISRLCAAVHWFNPLHARLDRRLALDVEMACDQTVLSTCSNVHDYARTLLNAAAHQNPDHGPPTLATAMANLSSWQQRLNNLYHPEPTMNQPIKRLVCSLLIGLPLVGGQLSFAHSQDQTLAPSAPAPVAGPTPPAPIMTAPEPMPAGSQPPAPAPPADPLALPATSAAPLPAPRATDNRSAMDARIEEVRQLGAMRDAQGLKARTEREQARARRDQSWLARASQDKADAQRAQAAVQAEFARARRERQLLAQVQREAETNEQQAMETREKAEAARLREEASYLRRESEIASAQKADLAAEVEALEQRLQELKQQLEAVKDAQQADAAPENASEDEPGPNDP